MRLQGCRCDSGGEAYLAQVSADGPPLVVDVQVLPFDQLCLDLLRAVQDLLVGQCSASVVLVGDAVHEGVLLHVDHGPEQVVPQGEAEAPVPPELGLGSSLHGRCPCVDFHLGGLRVASAAPSPVLLVSLGVRLAVLDVGAGGPVREAEAEGRGEVERLELVHEGVARAHFESVADPLAFLLGLELVLEVVQGGRRHGVLVLAVLVAAFRKHGSGSLVGEDGAGLLHVLLRGVCWGRCLLRLQLVARLVLLGHAVDDLQHFRRHAALRQLRRGLSEGFLSQVLECGMP